MKSNNLDTEEREILNSYERGEWRSVPALHEERQRYQAYAAAFAMEKGLVTISLPKEDLTRVQQKAVEVGVPYQTLLADVIHRFVSGHLVEQPAA